MLVAGGATVLAWTFAHAAIDLYADLGTAPGTPVELTHVAGTTGLVGVSVVVTTLLIQLDVPPLSPLSAGEARAGAIALTAALCRSRPRMFRSRQAVATESVLLRTCSDYRVGSDADSGASTSVSTSSARTRKPK